MTDHQFYILWGEALTAADRDAYVSDWATSSLFLGPEDESPIPESLIQELGRIWDAAHMSIAALRATTGLSQALFAERYCIPKRTVENWESRGGCPDYVRLLLLRSCSLI